MTHRQQFNRRYGFERGASHSLPRLVELTGIPRTVLAEVDRRGRGAWKTNIRSVRTKGTFKKNEDRPRKQKLSAEQWGRARVYAFINKLQAGAILNHDVDLALEVVAA